MKKHEQGRQCDSPERNAEILDCEGKVDKIPEKEFERMIARVPKKTESTIGMTAIHAWHECSME